jgi:hypothetical protein
MSIKLLIFSLLTLFAMHGTASAVEFRTVSEAKSGKLSLAPGWEVKEKDGKAKAYPIDDGGVKAICMKSDKASFSVQRKIAVDIKEYPYVTWRWKVSELPKGGDFRHDGTDDQAAQLFVLMDGRESISYIWDPSAPLGATGSHYIPMVMKVRILVVDSGEKDKGRWVSVTRNVYEDYKKLFGKEPPLAEGLRFQINSQHTGTSAESCLEYVEFRKSP